MAVAQIALGSNLGDRAANLAAAIAHLKQLPGITITAVSSPYDNPAVGGPSDSPPFLNAAAMVQTDLPARALLSVLHRVEAKMGRHRREKWEPRVIDLDLLLYGDHVIDGPDLTVPHPLMHKRAFVLIPLAEIAPAAVHPIFGKTVGELLSSIR
jgi:2-amino-4-hydroxy-6-hydroxymethyldihydropteridine diphosphokinase